MSDKGGGLLVFLTGETLHPSWRDQPLATLLPIHLAGATRGLTVQPYTIRLTPAGARNPVFRIADGQSAESAWQEVPRFSEYAITGGVKAGAEVWAERAGGSGNAPLIVSHRYGQGRVMTIGVANLWRWRLAKQANPEHFDRFWQQLFHYLADTGRGAVDIHLVDTWLAPRTDLTALLEWRTGANDAKQPSHCQFLVQTSAGQTVSVQQVTLQPNQPSEVTFRVEHEGTYHLLVVDPSQKEQGNRTVEIKSVMREWLRTGRDMESLLQWAQLSRGLAVKLEDCPNAEQLLQQIRQRAEQAYQRRTVRRPAGVTTAVLLWVLALLSTEWALRRWWQWT